MKRLSSLERTGFTLAGLALVASLPSLLALSLLGVISKHDSLGYIAYADEIRAHAVPTGNALLHESPVPISLFRIGGFPALLAALELMLPRHWPIFLVLLQIAAQSGVAILTYLTALKLNARPALALAAALLPAFGFVIAVNICILTDALYSAAITTAAFMLILRPTWRGAALAGLLIALATSFREATIFLVLAFIPIALCQRPRWLPVALVVLPAWLVGAGQMSWNLSRGAGPVLTTSAQVTMVQALLPLLRHHIPVFNAASPFGQIANQTVGAGGYDQMLQLQIRLFSAGYTAPQIARAASQTYAQTWRRYPGQMLAATISNYNLVFLAMPFDPPDVAAYVVEYDDIPRPVFTRLNLLWRGILHGHVSDLGWLGSILAARGGGAIGLYGLISPWRRQPNNPFLAQLRALWCLPVAFAVLYMPVHLEYRYLLPGVPIICLLAAVGWSGPAKPPSST